MYVTYLHTIFVIKKFTILNQKVILRVMDYRGIYATGRESFMYTQYTKTHRFALKT